MRTRDSKHRLDRVTFTLQLPRQENDFHTTVTAVGTAETKRAHLWVASESWSRPSTNYDYDACTFLHHIALVAVTDAPDTRELLDQQMHGLAFIGEGWWEQPKLAFS